MVWNLRVIAVLVRTVSQQNPKKYGKTQNTVFLYTALWVPNKIVQI